MTLDAFYLPASAGQRFCLFHQPDDRRAWRGALVYIHPFAEEMNKSRRMAALQARALATAGYAVLQIDLDGCGDSSGDFGDASWASWIDDVRLAALWLRQRSDAPLWLWGLRSGALLAGAAAGRSAEPSNLLLWQPVLSGKQFLQQFLRLKLAGEMKGGDGKGLMARLREQLAHGESVEIAGYRLSPSLAGGLEKAELAAELSELCAPAQVARIEWIEVSARPDAGLSPLTRTRLENWRSAGRLARGTVVGGPAFWQTAEIAQCPELIEASIAALSQHDAP
jgi:exosortase A-associated hydrolase 2